MLSCSSPVTNTRSSRGLEKHHDLEDCNDRTTRAPAFDLARRRERTSYSCGPFQAALSLKSDSIRIGTLPGIPAHRQYFDTAGEGFPL